MANNELIKQIEALNEWETIIAEAKAEAQKIEEQIKTEMDERNLEELEVGTFIVRYTSILTSRFDTTAFKKSYSDIYKQFLKQSASRRFTISQ